MKEDAVIIPLSAESGWFYSSISQVTGGLAGFLGGVLVLRIQANRARWRQAKQDIDKEIRKFERFLKRGISEKSRDSLDNRREEILDLAITGVAAQFPGELIPFALFLAALLAIGVIFPLAVLEAPDVLTRILLPLIVCIVTCLAVLYLFYSAHEVLKKHTRDYCAVKEEYEKTLEEIEEKVRLRHVERSLGGNSSPC